MKISIDRTPLLITVVGSLLLLLHGPIAQLPNYHHFADEVVRLGIAHAADVISNVGFAVVGVWGYAVLRPLRAQVALQSGWIGYRLFLLALILTALGSTF